MAFSPSYLCRYVWASFSAVSPLTTRSHVLIMQSMTTTNTTGTAAAHIWTKAEVQALLNTRADAVERAIVALYALQEADERAAYATYHDNDRGFNKYDAAFGSSLAGAIKQYGHLTIRQQVAARKLVYKYAGQLARIANARVAQAAQ